MHTIRDALADAGHEVAFIHVDKRDAPEGGALDPPSWGRVGWNLLTRFVPGLMSLRECRYYSPALVRQVMREPPLSEAQFIIAFSAGAAVLVAQGDKPWIVDLGELSSRRYERLLAERADLSLLLGRALERWPGPVRSVVGRVVRPVLRFDAKVLRRRELHYAQRADGVCLAAADEVQLLTRRSGRDARWMPLSVAVPREPAPAVETRPMSAVFVGDLANPAHLAAVNWYAQQVAPFLQRFGLDELVLNVIGPCPDRARTDLASAPVKFVGQVNDVPRELAKHQVFIAPAIAGTGPQTRVVEAMAAGLPVVGTPAAFEGLGATHDEHAFVASMPIEMAQCLRYVNDRPKEAGRVALAGRQLVEQRFSQATLTRRWCAWVDHVVATRGKPGGGEPAG